MESVECVVKMLAKSGTAGIDNLLDTGGSFAVHSEFEESNIVDFQDANDQNLPFRDAEFLQENHAVEFKNGTETVHIYADNDNGKFLLHDGESEQSYSTQIDLTKAISELVR